MNTSNMRAWLNFTKLYIFIAGGQEYLNQVSLKRLAHFHFHRWDPMSAARQLMQEMTNGEYLRAIHPN